jgi:hypothetical protein
MLLNRGDILRRLVGEDFLETLRHDSPRHRSRFFIPREVVRPLLAVSRRNRNIEVVASLQHLRGAVEVVAGFQHSHTVDGEGFRLSDKGERCVFFAVLFHFITP